MKSCRKKLKIVLCCQSLGHGRGGTEKVVVSLANEMAKRDHEVYLAFYAPRPSACIPKYEVSQNCHLITWGLFGLSIAKFRKRIEEINPDVVTIFYATWFGWELYRIFSGLNYPIIYQECSNPTRIVTDNWNNRKNSQNERDALVATGCLVRVTRPEYINSFPDFIKPRVRYFPNAFNIKNINLRPKDRFRKNIIHIGGYKDNKNLIELLMAFRIVASDFPEWNILICSTIPRSKITFEYCLDFIVKNDLLSRVVDCGSVEDVDSLFFQSDLHIITSLSEGLPNCVCEAMTHAIPSIGYAECSGTNSLINNGYNGILVDSKSRVDGLAEAMRKLMGDDRLRAKLGFQAYLDASMFAPSSVYRTWEDVFYEAVADKNATVRDRSEKIVDVELLRKYEDIRLDFIRWIHIRLKVFQIKRVMCYLLKKLKKRCFNVALQ